MWTWLAGLTSVWGWIKIGVIAALFVFIATLAWSYVHDYRAIIEENAALKVQIGKYDGRLASYKRMIDRRDAAIGASQCKNQITRWLRNPEDIPGQDDHFRHPLTPKDGVPQPNANDTEPVAPFEWPEFSMPDLSKALPWNWF